MNCPLCGYDVAAHDDPLAEVDFGAVAEVRRLELLEHLRENHPLDERLDGLAADRARLDQVEAEMKDLERARDESAVMLEGGPAADALFARNLLAAERAGGATPEQLATLRVQLEEVHDG